MIYTPRGKAREYAPYALNLFDGCPHRCKYCYVPAVLRKDADTFATATYRATTTVEKIEKSASAMFGSESPVLLSFTSDPYPAFDVDALTRKAISILFKYRIPVIVLSKGGDLIRRDFDLFSEHLELIKVGATMTGTTPSFVAYHEEGAASFQERAAVLCDAHKLGIKTWISVEPVIDPAESLSAIKETLPFVDEYRIGKLSPNNDEYRACANSTDWDGFLDDALGILRAHGKSVYVKRELASSVRVALLPNEVDLARFDRL